MQNTEMYRRGVVVALDDAAEVAIVDQNVDDSTLVYLVEIGSQSEFEQLWQAGVFSAINNASGCQIDDYEEESVPAQVVPRIRKAIGPFTDSNRHGESPARFCKELLKLCDLSERTGRPMHFIL